MNVIYWRCVVLVDTSHLATCHRLVSSPLLGKKARKESLSYANCNGRGETDQSALDAKVYEISRRTFPSSVSPLVGAIVSCAVIRIMNSYWSIDDSTQCFRLNYHATS